MSADDAFLFVGEYDEANNPTQIRQIEVASRAVTTLTSTSISSASVAVKEMSREQSCLKTVLFAADAAGNQILAVGTGRSNLVPDHEIPRLQRLHAHRRLYDSSISATAVNGAAYGQRHGVRRCE